MSGVSERTPHALLGAHLSLMSSAETATEISDLELRTVHSIDGGQNQREEETGREQTLPRADGGKDAWLFLLGCFMIEFLVWGKLGSYYYTRLSDNLGPMALVLVLVAL